MIDPWTAIEKADQKRLTQLFADDPDRLARFTLEEAGIYFDWSKTHLTGDVVEAFATLAETRDLAGKREALFSGEIVNPTEGRAAEHSAQRGQGSPEAVALANQLHARMRSLAEAVDAGALGDIRHVLHIGIGGSALGPELVIEALGDAESDYDVAIVSNIDGQALVGPFELFDPAHTLVVLASKSFTTMETMLNAESVIRWMRDGGVADPFGQFVAVTAAPDKAVEFGIDETRVLPFPETVGGRYSLWSSIGFAAALALGWEAFEQLLEGAGAMDRHSRLAEWHENAPAMAAFVDLYYAQRGAETRALFAYDERLRLLPDWLQQLAMESNGKRVTADGDPLGRASSAIVWGGTGTDAQHAVFQLLHQGTHLVPVEFLAVAEPGHDLDPAHHEALLVNCFAQGAALMAGRENADDPARDFPGDRPSTTILLERLDPATLGALLAFYEQRTFVEAVLLGINPFDQYGVELGKDIARAIAADEEQALELDISTKALIERGL